MKDFAKSIVCNSKVGNASKSEIIEKKKKEGATLKVDNGQKLEFSDGSTYVKTSFSDDYREAHNYVGNAEAQELEKDVEKKDKEKVDEVKKLETGNAKDKNGKELKVGDKVRVNEFGKPGKITKIIGGDVVEVYIDNSGTYSPDRIDRYYDSEVVKVGNFKTGKSNLKPGDKIISFGKSGTVKGVYDEDADTIYGEPLIEVEFEDGTTKKIGEHYMRKVGNSTIKFYGETIDLTKKSEIDLKEILEELQALHEGSDEQRAIKEELNRRKTGNDAGPNIVAEYNAEIMRLTRKAEQLRRMGQGKSAMAIEEQIEKLGKELYDYTRTGNSKVKNDKDWQVFPTKDGQVTLQKTDTRDGWKVYYQNYKGGYGHDKTFGMDYDAAKRYADQLVAKFSNAKPVNNLDRAFNAMAKNDVIAIKEAWGWTIKDYTGEVPTGKTFKIFKTRNDADKWIEEQ